MCEGNVYPCTLFVKVSAKTLSAPLRCPYNHAQVKWEEVSDQNETISYDTEGRRL